MYTHIIWTESGTSIPSLWLTSSSIPLVYFHPRMLRHFDTAIRNASWTVNLGYILVTLILKTCTPDTKPPWDSLSPNQDFSFTLATPSSCACGELCPWGSHVVFRVMPAPTTEAHDFGWKKPWKNDQSIVLYGDHEAWGPESGQNRLWSCLKRLTRIVRAPNSLCTLKNWVKLIRSSKAMASNEELRRPGDRGHAWQRWSAHGTREPPSSYLPTI